jgi:hypothetical protein
MYTEVPAGFSISANDYKLAGIVVIGECKCNALKDYRKSAFDVSSMEFIDDM